MLERVESKGLREIKTDFVSLFVCLFVWKPQDNNFLWENNFILVRVVVWGSVLDTDKGRCPLHVCWKKWYKSTDFMLFLFLES